MLNSKICPQLSIQLNSHIKELNTVLCTYYYPYLYALQALGGFFFTAELVAKTDTF